MLRFHWLATLSLVLVLAPATGARAEDYRDPQRHFTLALPDGWTVASDMLLAIANELGKEAGVTYTTGFQPRELLPGGYPYVLVQVHKANMAVSYDDLERALTRGRPEALREVKEKVGDIVSELKVGQIAVDRARNRVVSRLEMTLADGRAVHDISYGMFGKEGVVTLHCYALEADFAEYLPVFNQLVESFRYDDGFQFVPSTRRPGRPLGFDWPGGLIGGAAGAVVGAGAYAFIRTMRRRRGRAPMQRATDQPE